MGQIEILLLFFCYWETYFQLGEELTALSSNLIRTSENESHSQAGLTREEGIGKNRLFVYWFFKTLQQNSKGLKASVRKCDHGWLSTVTLEGWRGASAPSLQLRFIQLSEVQQLQTQCNNVKEHIHYILHVYCILCDPCTLWIRGCSHIMSAKIRGSWTPPPPSVGSGQHPFPLLQTIIPPKKWTFLWKPKMFIMS